MRRIQSETCVKMWRKDTKTICPACGREISAQLREEKDDIYLHADCPEHGSARTLFFKSADLYRTVLDDDSGLPGPDPLNLDDPKVADYLTTFAVDLTTRCNLRCPHCFAQAQESDESEPTVDEILEMIPDYRGRSRAPNISLVGGESTLRPDLPDIIKAIIEKRGLVPRLNTNGILLLENDLLARLKAAGLQWIILQFDGFDADASVAFRGRDLRALKDEVIERAGALGFFLHLAIMVKKGVNDGDAASIVDYAAKQPDIRRVSFYPCSEVGRTDDDEKKETHVLDVMEALEKGSRGDILVGDFIAAKKIGNRYYKATKNPMFRPRPCMFPLVIYRHENALIPCNRFFSFGTILKYKSAFYMFMKSAWRMLKPDEGRFSPDFLFINIEKFYSDHGFDFIAARNCHHIYLTKGGAYPFCCYNSLHRNSADKK